jgi:outer membrane biosynthesis protein TonB
MSNRTAFKGNRMKNVKLFLIRSITLAVTAIFLLSYAPKAWSDETGAPDAGAPPAAGGGMSNEGVPPAPGGGAAEPGMGGAEVPREAPPAEEPPPAPKKKKKSSKKSAKKKKSTSKKKKKKSTSKKKKKKKKKPADY